MAHKDTDRTIAAQSSTIPNFDQRVVTARENDVASTIPPGIPVHRLNDLSSDEADDEDPKFEPTEESMDSEVIRQYGAPGSRKSRIITTKSGERYWQPNTGPFVPVNGSPDAYLDARISWQETKERLVEENAAKKRAHSRTREENGSKSKLCTE